MTADATNTPFSVDYTGRDYYAIREQLIARVKDRVPDWTGNNSSDFGLALIESFAYMGDMLNYYIDRVANEAYILTATQRETLLNLSKMYGYSPSNYTSAVVDIDFTNNNGYKKSTGAEIIEDGIITGDTVVHSIAKVIVPNDHPFTVDGPYDTAIIEGITPLVTGTVGGVSIDYNTSVYNGTFKVIKTGYENIGRNVIWYRPSAKINSITTSGTEMTVFYAGSITAEVGQKIRISGVSVSSGNGYNGNWYIKSVTPATDATLSSLTIDSAALSAKITKVIGNGTTVTYSTFDSVTTELYGYTTPTWHNFIANQKVAITGVISSDNTGGTANTGYNFNTATVASVTDIATSVTNVLVSGSDVTFTVGKQFSAGQIVSIRGIKSTSNLEGLAGNQYNVTDSVIASVSTSTATITDVVGDESGTGVVTFTTSSSHGFLKDQIVTITGVVSTDSDGNDSSVYNIKSAQIKSVPTSTSFTVNAYWVDEFKSGGTATLYKFTISKSGLSAETVTNTGIIGGAFCKQFTVTSNKNGTFTSGGQAVALIGGSISALTDAEITYADLPAVIDTGGFVRNVGTTTIPAGSQISTQITSSDTVKNIVFSTLNDITVPFGGTTTALVKHGEQVSTRTENAANTTVLGYDIAGEVLGNASSNSDANQIFPLKESTVDSNSVRVFVDRGTAFEEWTRVPHIIDYGPSDTVFELDITNTNQVRILFGDGISGEIPPPEATIKAQYIAGGGLIGNVQAETLTTWGKVINSTTEEEEAIRKISISNQLAATGGGDPESNDSIRYNAPRALRTLNRAVTLQDFEDLSLSVERVAKAKAVATNRNSVTVYISPMDDGTSDRPGYLGSDLSSSWDYIKTGVEDYLSDKLQIGTSVTVSAPVYSYIFTDISFTPLPQYSSSVVKTNIKKMMVTDFGYENTDFNDVITPEEIEFKLRQVEGVQNAKVISLYRADGSGRNTIIGEVNELFVFSEDSIGLIPASTDAALKTFTITPSSGSSSWAPIFKSNLLSYRVTIPAAATSITVGTEANDTNDNDSSGVASVTVNGKSVGAAAYNSTIPTTDTTVGARTEVVVTVTAADGSTVSTYKAVVVKV